MTASETVEAVVIRLVFFFVVVVVAMGNSNHLNTEAAATAATQTISTGSCSRTRHCQTPAYFLFSNQNEINQLLSSSTSSSHSVPLKDDAGTTDTNKQRTSVTSKLTHMKKNKTPANLLVKASHYEIKPQPIRQNNSKE
jgi:hypothetical protein